MKCGGKKCIYRTGAGEPGVSGKCDMTCNYALITGKTKLGQIYEQYGITNYDQRAAKILGRIKCPFYSPGDRIRQSRTELLLHGSKPGKYDWARGMELYNAGATDKDIATELGCTYESVKRWRWKHALSVNPAQKAPGKLDWARGRALYEGGASDRAIAGELGCSVTAVFEWRKREKLPSVVGKENRDWARGRALYEKGMSDRKIAQALGAHPESVRKWRGREGLPPNSCGGRQRKEKENDL